MWYPIHDMKREAKGSSGDELVARVNGLKDLITYQEGAIVSRTLINKHVGTVTLFSFDEGQGLSEHTAPYDAMVHILDGEAEVVIEGKSLRLSEGEMTIMPANKTHALKAITSFKMLLTMIRA